jgi:signal transduction histidine kinase/PAS domain-containing protein
MTALSVRLPSQAYHYETRDGGPPRASSRQELSAVTLLEALDHDDRPSFAIDVETCCAHDEPLELIYCNPAFKAVDKLSPRVAGYRDVTNVFAESSQLQLAFREWVRGHVNENDPHRRGTTYMFDGYIWGAVTIGGYRIISGIPALSLWVDASGQGGKSDRILTPQEGKAPLQEESSTHSRKHRAVPSIPQLSPGNDGSLARGIADGPANHYGPFDYTREHLPATVKTSSHIKYFHNVDWATTPLGAMNTWSEDLRCMVNMVLNNKFPATLFLGDECIPLYNEPYIQLLGSFHPCMGKPIGTEAPHHWSAFQSIVDHIKATGESVAEYDMLLFIDRHGFVEETHWSFQLVPVLDSNGLVAAYYQTFYEVTDHRLLERRVSSLVAMSMQIAKAMDFQSYWDLTLGSLMLNEQDVPFALLYSAERHVSADMSAVTSPGSIPPLETCKLKGAIGVEVEHPIAPATIHINDDPYVFQSYIHQAAKSGKATIVDLKELQLPGKRLLEDIKWRGYGDPCRIVVICPILPTTGDQVGGFLILGINPRRPFDEQYQQFVQIMVRLLASSFASVALFEEEVHQRENAIVQAALIQEQLLAEIKSREKKFQRFAERSNVGIFITDPVGNYTYRNQRWYDLFEVAALDDNATTAWDRIAFPEDIPYCQSIFAKLIIEHESVLFELRTQMPWHPPDELTEPESEDTSHYKWILCSAYPELNDNGELVEIVGNVTDISKQKHAETTHRQRTDSALQGKQHLEHFIDTTSHEMRNPLSAILQCADGILTSYSYDERQPPTPSSWSSFLESTLDAAQTIVQCAQHMRHIVDDILTISKLDSGLLLITPVVAQPESIVRHVFKMYEAEAIAAGVDMSLVIDQSVRDMNVDWVSLDPTRVLQILINVITNALKFTRLETTRRVTVTFAASAVEPSTVSGGIQFNEDRLVSPDPTLENDWKQAEELFYLQFFVTDTGRGLSEEEMSSLFTRFSQASPRTHIHYGLSI